MNYLGLDWGKSKIGVAIAGEEAKIASPILVLRFNKIQEVLEKINEIIEQEGVKVVVIGKPVSLSGQEKEDQNFKDFTSRIENIENIKVVLEDERLSTKYAQSLKKEFQGYKKVGDDDIAAAVILQSYLDRL